MHKWIVQLRGVVALLVHPANAPAFPPKDPQLIQKREEARNRLKSANRAVSTMRNVAKLAAALPTSPSPPTVAVEQQTTPAPRSNTKLPLPQAAALPATRRSPPSRQPAGPAAARPRFAAPQAAVQPTLEDQVQAEIAALQAENAALKGTGASPGQKLRAAMHPGTRSTEQAGFQHV